MRLTYLGTAAAEGFPAIFCNCEYCNEARRLGGKNIRTRSQALVNDDLLIDFLCGYTGLDSVARYEERLSGYLAGLFHQHDLFRFLDYNQTISLFNYAVSDLVYGSDRPAFVN